MPAETWPIGFPQKLLREDNSGRLGDGLIETQPDIGPPISRPRSTAVVDELAGSVLLTEAQLGQLKTFFRVTLAQGALPFYFPDQTTANDPVLVKFPKGRAPSWREVGPDTYRVQLTLSVLP